MRLPFLALLLLNLFLIPAASQDTRVIYLSGKGTNDAVEWDFFCTSGMNSGKWSKLPVPSNWELHGFGNYNYGHDNSKSDEKGLYRYRFNVPSDWKSGIVEIVFEASMTDTKVKINGKSAGEIHQGGFYRFSYDITKLINFGKENLLEVEVSKMSANESVNLAERKADYWVFGGIFRPVFIQSKPSEHILRYALDARSDGSFMSEVYTRGIKKADKIKAVICKAGSTNEVHSFITKIDNKENKHVISSLIDSPDLWNPEFPNLYVLKLELLSGDKILHTENGKFGFRTVEVRERDGIYVNDEKIFFKGVCRHSFWPSTGRALDQEFSLMDVQLIKEMNMNAVRMSHYPPDPHFLDICDSLGLFVLNELAGWQAPAYDTEVGEKLVKELVCRDVNHPSIVLWNNGNEGGFNYDLVDDYDLYDPQKRKVVHPWELMNGMNTQHYISWNYGQNTYFNGRDIFFPTEFLHGLYDGGHGAGLDDYYNLMLQRPLSAGGFLWDFSDGGVVRTDKDGILDTQKNNAADGILGPYREKEGSFFTIREIWCPVYVELENLPTEFSGKMNITNRYIYTDLKDCNFKAGLKSPLGIISSPEEKSWKLKSPSIMPGNKGFLDMELPANWKDYQVLWLTAIDPHGKEIMTWTWPCKNAEDFAVAILQNDNDNEGVGKVEISEEGNNIILETAGRRFTIGKSSGMLEKTELNGAEIPFGNGPVLAHGESLLKNIEYNMVEGRAEVRAEFEKGFTRLKWILHPGGWLELDYNYHMNGEYVYAGINFSFPEENVKSVNYLGDGPYRVWKNRMKGPQFDWWHKDYNNTVTGESWDYPEFKGYHSRFCYAEIETDNFPVRIISAEDDLFLRLYTPESPKGAYNKNTSPEFPEGDISFLHSITPIGTKFRPAKNTGPQGGLNEFAPHASMPASRGGRLFFYFGND